MQRKGKGIFAFLVLLLLFGTAAPLVRAKAADGQLVITEIDYESETLTVTSSNGDSYLYYSDSKMKKWERAYGSFEDGKFVLDISWVSKTKNYVLTLKGDKSEEAVTVTLPKQDTAFRATYNFIKESFTFVSADGLTVYWRKADSTTWQAVDETTKLVLRRLYARGASIYLRAGQVKGGTENGVLRAGSRPSKEVKVSLTKQASAPSVSINASAQISVSTKKEYRVDDAAEWTTCKGTTLAIAEAAAAAFYNGNTPGKDVSIYIRVAATEKKLPSASAMLTVLAQDTAPTDIGAEFTSTSTLQFTIPKLEDEDGNVLREAPSSSNPYEYTIVKEGEELSDSAVWTKITSETTNITSAKAPTGSVVYIRRRGGTESTLVYRPESLAYAYTVGEYPSSSTVALAEEASLAAFLDENGKVSLVKTEGDDAEGLKFKITVTEIFDTDVSAITCGGKALTYVTTKENNDIFVTITKTDTYESEVTTRDTAQNVQITLKNGEVIQNAVTLTVLHGTSLSAKKSFTVNHGIAASSGYEFNIVPGLLLAKDTDGDYLAAQIASITMLDEEIAYTVTEETDGSYTVALNADALENMFYNSSAKADTAYSLCITLENGQTITSGVTVTLTEEAAVSSTSYFMVKTEGSDLTEDVQIQLTCAKSNVYVVAATWNGTDIMGSCTGGAEGITVSLSYLKLNALTLPEGQTILTAPVIFTLNDGALVSLGYQITLRK